MWCRFCGCCVLIHKQKIPLSRCFWLPILCMLVELLARLAQVAGDRVALQRVTLDVPAGHDLAGLIFVVRSADSTVWWRDGALCIPVWVP